jgi:hypothetical protein
MTRDNEPVSAEEQLSELFGSYKAEWLKERLFDFFTAPNYLPELMTVRPCVLVGGRGTGKTTVLRGLSYEGQFVLKNRKADEIPNWKFYGLYLRVNTNRVTAFAGPEVPDDTWIKLFGHYINLLLADLVLRFLTWFKLYADPEFDLPAVSCKKIAASLQMPPADNLRTLLENLDAIRIAFEAYINNVADDPKQPISMQGAPVDALFNELAETNAFKSKVFFFLVDEYENYLDYQQQVFNTLIKHSGSHYSFKIGVRELGWRIRTTLNKNEQLISPADYVKINIADKLQEENFKRFASSVCNARLNRLDIPGHMAPRSIEDALPGITEEEEAGLLDVEDQLEEVRSSIMQLPEDARATLNELSPLQLWVLKFWSAAQEQPLDIVMKSFLNDREKWADRFNNYKYASLFSLKRGKRGVVKYYAGFDTFAQLAAGNIRYLIELVDQSLLLHVRKGCSLADPVPVETQTRAAQNVGKKNLAELEGLSVEGAHLTKLVLGLGRIFQVMSAQPEGHAPEINQFRLEDKRLDSVLSRDVDNVLRAAVMHLALLRFPGSKLADEAETRDYDYMLHPVFSAFFVFSHRRKRKMPLTSAELLGLIRNPREYISQILFRHRRNVDEQLPEQVALFEGYYGHRT